MNMYITRANEEWLRKQDNSMSGIVNKLLDRERGVSSLDVAKETFAEELGITTQKLEEVLAVEPHYEPLED